MSHMNLARVEDSRKFKVDIGNAREFLGTRFTKPWFFESYTHLMMEDYTPVNLHFKTFNGEIFQFRIGKYHGQEGIWICSTLEDSFFVGGVALSLDKMRERYTKSSNKKHKVKDSFSGYYSYGKRLIEGLDILEKHMDEEGLYFSYDSLKAIYRELRRRKKNANKRITNT